jgi:hypothetical protein
LVSNSATITMMHGPINIRYRTNVLLEKIRGTSLIDHMFISYDRISN